MTNLFVGKLCSGKKSNTMLEYRKSEATPFTFFCRLALAMCGGLSAQTNERITESSLKYKINR